MQQRNPIVIFIYFLSAALLAMFSMNPIFLLLSLMGALTLFFLRNRGKKGRFHLFSLGLFLVIALVNPLFQHNGVTVLFVMNGNPITWEACFYGITAGLMTVSVLYWFSLMTETMTSDQYLYIFGKCSPNMALLLSMALRFVPLFNRRMKRIRMTQKAIGLYRENTLMDKIRSEVRIFSIMVTWVLENGIHTADSMEARGYGIGKRTQFALYRFRKSDIIALILILGLLSICLLGLAFDLIDFVFYPTILMHEHSIFSVLIYISYGIFVFLPAITEAEEGIRWHCLRSKI